MGKNMKSNALIRNECRFDVVNHLDMWCEQNKIAILTEVSVWNNIDTAVSIRGFPRRWQLSEKHRVGAFPW